MTITRCTRSTAWGLAAAAVFWGLPGRASAQDPCDVVFKQAAQVMGSPAGKTESAVTPTKTARVCTVRAGDGDSHISLNIETSPSAAKRITMARTMATMAKDPDQTVKDEAALGASAFSLREKDTVTFMMADATRFLTLRVGKDRGMADADVERARQLAQQLLGAR